MKSILKNIRKTFVFDLETQEKLDELKEYYESNFHESLTEAFIARKAIKEHHKQIFKATE